MRIIFILFIFLLFGCDASKKPTEIIKTSHDEIEKRFAANGVEAASYYDGKIVELTGSVNTIHEYGTVILVGDSMNPLAVNFSEEASQALKSIKVGDKITVRCNSVSSIDISQCEYINTQK